MIVVADTSPLNYLIRLGHVDILKSIYGQVVVPQSVLTEMQHPDAPLEVRRWASAPPPWIKRICVQHWDASLPIELGAGEREAISLALELSADLLLIDEFMGRQQAEQRHISVAGTLAVLLQASLRAHLEFAKELERLRKMGFRVSPRIASALLECYGQARIHNVGTTIEPL